MLTGFHQHTAKIDERLPIQLQRFNSGAPGASHTQNFSPVVRPGEMIGPALATRMKQGHDLASDRIAGFGAIVFVIVTSLTRKRQVPWRPRSSTATRQDVFERKALMRKRGGAAAVLAAPLSAA